MNRDLTVALFLECEARRKEARAAALAEGKSSVEDIAHEAAKAHWNAWADGMLAKRKALEANGLWAVPPSWATPNSTALFSRKWRSLKQSDATAGLAWQALSLILCLTSSKRISRKRHASIICG